MVLKVTCFTLLVLSFAQSGVIPVEKCKLDDKTCLKTAFQKMVPVFMAGMPEQNVEVMDPADMNLKFDLAGLQFTLSEGTLKGLKSSLIDDVEWDTEKKVFSVDFHMDSVVKGHYTAAGRILILPITGDGQTKLKLKHLQIKMKIHYEIVKGADGKDRIKPTKYSFEFDVKEGAHYQLTNLFNGNKELSDTLLTFLNENWKQVATEFGRPMIETAAKMIFKNIINFFDAMPIEDIAIV